MKIHFESMASPVGTLHLAATEDRLVALAFEDHEDAMRASLARRHGTGRLAGRGDPLGAVDSLEAYFAGDLAALDALAAEGDGTPFQRAVWTALREIPPASTASYGEIAARLGKPGASRAVGRANGQNPVAIVVPCHRVIGANGTLTGYGGGLPRKRWLLAHEQTHSPG